MRLEEALKLRKGDFVRANISSSAPEVLTQGREYKLQKDARQLSKYEILDGDSGILVVGRESDEQARDAVLPIVDDDGKLKEASYLCFEIAKRQ